MTKMINSTRQNKSLVDRPLSLLHLVDGRLEVRNEQPRMMRMMENEKRRKKVELLRNGYERRSLKNRNGHLARKNPSKRKRSEETDLKATFPVLSTTRQRWMRMKRKKNDRSSNEMNLSSQP